MQVDKTVFQSCWYVVMPGDIERWSRVEERLENSKEGMKTTKLDLEIAKVVS